MYTLTQVQDAASRLDRDRTNPEEGYGCVYTHSETGEHCLVGQLFADLAPVILAAIEATDKNAVALAILPDTYTHGVFDEQAIAWMIAAQEKADDHHRDTNDERYMQNYTWGEAIDHANNTWEVRDAD